MRRDSTLHMRLSGNELHTMKMAADAAGHSSLSSWLRCIAYEAAACGGSGRELTAALVAVRGDLGRIGNNANQIAKHLNQGGSGSVSLSFINQIEGMRARLTETLSRTLPAVPLR